MTLESLLSRFENPQRAGSGFKARCPTHDDQKNSLTISKGANSKILLKCQAGCQTRGVIEAVGLEWRDLFPESQSVRGQNDDAVTSRYVYTDEQSKPIFRVCRTQSKRFFQQRSENGKWVSGLNRTRRVLYRLPDVLKSESVYIVEGEKDADRLAEIGLAATTNPGGAGKWNSLYNESLRDSHVIILPDNDQPGREHAAAIARSVAKVANSVKIINLPVPEKGDVSDFLLEHTKNDLLKLVEAGADFTDDASEKAKNDWPEFISAKDLLSLPPDPTRWVWKETLPFGGGSVLVSKPKIGKSTFAVNLSISIARGLQFLNRETIQCPVAYLSLDASLPEIAETFTRFGLIEDDQIFIHAGAAPRDAIKWVTERIREKGVRFVVVDTLQRLFRFQNLNDYSEVTNTLEPLLEAVREQNAHVMFLHHAKKDAGDDLDSAIGSTAIRGLAYAYLHLKRLPSSERRILRSDQRGGKNFSELQVGFARATDRLEVKGTMEEAEIEDAEPGIIEFVESQEGEVTERQIGTALPLRAIIISKTLRKLTKDGTLKRGGKGRKGSPYRYSAVTFKDSLPDEGGMGGEDPGRETQDSEKSVANSKEILFPDGQEEHGKRTEENQKNDESGREFDRESEWEEIEL